MAQPTSKPHILIVGAGLGGLTLAQILRKHGVSFEIFERDASEAARYQGWSLGLHNQVEELIGSVPDDMPPFKESVAALHPLNIQSQIVLYFNDERIGINDTPNTSWVRANRQRFRTWLMTGIEVQYGKSASRVEESDNMATVFFKDGTSATGNLIVGADGVNSAVREYVLGVSNDATLQRLPVSTITGQAVLSGAAFESQLEVSHAMALIPVAAADTWNLIFQGINRVLPDKRSGEFFWILMWHDPLAWYMGHGLVDDLSQEERLKASLKMTEHMEPRFRQLLEHTAPEDIRALGWSAKDAAIDSLPVSRVTLLGDAAHPTSPFRGEGGVHALKDSIALGTLLSKLQTGDTEAIHNLVRTYQEEMVPRGATMVRRSRVALADYRNDRLVDTVYRGSAGRLPEENIKISPDGEVTVKLI